MRIARKVYMSIFTTMFILITCIATTFAWVGMLTTATLGSFDLNIKVVDNEDYDYYLNISTTGQVGSFSDTVNTNSEQTGCLGGGNQLLCQSTIDHSLKTGRGLLLIP